MKEFENQKHKDKIIDRIQKILNHANGSQYEAEASTAMKMAQSYMKQYGLSLSDVELKEQLEEAILKELSEHNLRKKTDKWEIFLAMAIGDIFDCKIILSKRYKASYIMFIGYQKDIQLCKATFKMMYQSAKSEAYKQFPRNMKLQRKSFLIGLSHRLEDRALEEKLSAKKEATGKYALMVIGKEKQIDNWIDKEMNITTRKRKRNTTTIDQGAYNKGRQHANTLDINNRSKLT